jgi:hypothetical protein
MSKSSAIEFRCSHNLPDGGTLKAMKRIAGGLLDSQKAARYKARCRRKNSRYRRSEERWVARLYLYTQRTLPRVTNTAETAPVIFALGMHEPDACSLSHSQTRSPVPGFP